MAVFIRFQTLLLYDVSITSGMFMTKGEAKVPGLSGSSLLVGKKQIMIINALICGLIWSAMWSVYVFLILKYYPFFMLHDYPKAIQTA